MFRSASLLASVLAAVVAAAVGLRPGPHQDEPEPPDRRETDDLVEELVGLLGHDLDELARVDAIVERLALLPPLAERDERKWREELVELWEDGEELEKSGDNRLYEDGRGRYIVDGRTRRPEALLIGMHGGGVGSGDAGNSHSAYREALDELDWVGVFPEVLEKTERGWTDSGTEEFVLELIDRARRTFEVDPDRVFLSGHSMGGYGSWALGGHHADRVAAIAPSAGGPTPVMDLDGNVIDVIEGIVPNLRNVPVRVYQSEDDPQVTPVANDTAVERLEVAQQRWGGYDFEYWRVDGRGHGFPPGGMLALLRKVADFEREPHPERVVWQPTLRWKRQFYWLWWDRPRENAIVVATLDRERNAVGVELEGSARGLHVLVDDAILDLEREVVVELNGEETFRGRVEPSLAILALTGRWGDPGRTYAARVPVQP